MLVRGRYGSVSAGGGGGGYYLAGYLLYLYYPIVAGVAGRLLLKTSPHDKDGSVGL